MSSTGGGDLHNPPHKKEEIESILENYPQIAAQEGDLLRDVTALGVLKGRMSNPKAQAAIDACERQYIAKDEYIGIVKSQHRAAKTAIESFGGMQEFEFDYFVHTYTDNVTFIEKVNKEGIPTAIGALAQEMNREAAEFTKSLRANPPQSPEEIEAAAQTSRQFEENYEIIIGLTRPYHELHQQLSAFASKTFGAEPAHGRSDAAEVDRQAELRRQAARDRMVQEAKARAGSHKVSAAAASPAVSGATPSLASPFEVVVAAPDPREVSVPAPSLHPSSGPSHPPEKHMPPSRVDPEQPLPDAAQKIRDIIQETPTRNEASEKVSDFVEEAKTQGRVQPLGNDGLVSSAMDAADSKTYEFNLSNLGKILPEHSTCMLVKRLKPDGTPHTEHGKIIQDVIYLDGSGNITDFAIIHDEPPTASIGPETRKELELISAKHKAELGHDIGKSRAASPLVSPTSGPSRSDSGAIMGDDADSSPAAASKPTPLGDITNLGTHTVPTRADGTALAPDAAAMAKAAAKEALMVGGVENRDPEAGERGRRQKGFRPTHMKENAEKPPYDGSVGASAEQTARGRQSIGVGARVRISSPKRTGGL